MEQKPSVMELQNLYKLHASKNNQKEDEPKKIMNKTRMSLMTSKHSAYVNNVKHGNSPIFKLKSQQLNLFDNEDGSKKSNKFITFC